MKYQEFSACLTYFIEEQLIHIDVLISGVEGSIIFCIENAFTHIIVCIETCFEVE